jgi:hypothetical protein
LRQALGVVVGIAAAYFGAGFFAKDLLLKSFLTAVAGGFASAAIATGSLKAGLWGAVSAAAFWGIGTAFSKTITETIQTSVGPSEVVKRVASGNAIAKVAAHAITGGTLTQLQGGKFGHGFIAAGFTEALSPAVGQIKGQSFGAILSRTAVSAAIGGTASKLSGGSFANGAQTGAFQQLFNESSHGGFWSEVGESVGNTLTDYKDGFDNFVTSEAVVNGVAGAGDVLSLNATAHIRDSYDIGSVDTLSTAYQNGGKIGMTIGMAGGAGVFRGAITFSRTSTITRWGGSGRWVMVGGKNTTNWWLSGTRFWRGYGYNTANTTTISSSRLAYPPGGEWFKGLLGQRVIK